MPRTKNPIIHLDRKLRSFGWPNLIVDGTKETLSYPQGFIVKLEGDNYKLNFVSFFDNQYSQRDSYETLTYPKNLDILNHLYFRNNGNYSISYESLFKKIINPTDKKVKVVKLVKEPGKRDFQNTILSVSIETFLSCLNDAEGIFNKSRTYRNSTRNYLAYLASKNYGNDVKQRTTYINQGEISFIVDRLNLTTKKRKADFLRYLDKDDLVALENLFDELLKKGVFSDTFLRKIDDFFIKERLKDIISQGRSIISLGKDDLSTSKAVKIISQLDSGPIRQLEGLWQKYFDKYLLYLIFSYKKIFPKIELKDVEGDKKYPDFIGVNHYNGLDVIEIKTHLTKILVWDSSHKNFYFSPEMSKAIVQATNYLDAIVQKRFKNEADERKITNFVDEENLYHPRAIIVISSRKKLANKTSEQEKLNRDFTKLRNGLHNIQILTFDEILDIADEYIKNIAKSDSDPS